MIAEKEQTIEWSAKDRIVFGKWAVYSKVRRMSPKFKYGAAPKGYDENYYIEDCGNKEYAVIHEVLGYTSLTLGHHPGRKEFLFEGTLKECKKWLIDLIKKCYEN